MALPRTRDEVVGSCGPCTPILSSFSPHAIIDQEQELCLFARALDTSPVERSRDFGPKNAARVAHVNQAANADVSCRLASAGTVIFVDSVLYLSAWT